MTTTTSFAGLLADLRRQHGITQRQLAQQTNLAERTLQRWEAGDGLPRRVELQKLLTHLPITPQDRKTLKALALLPTTPSVAATMPRTLPADMPAVPLGDLLWALRTRRGWTQDYLAQQLSLERKAVLRWEGEQTRPSEEVLGRIGALLCGTEGERQALVNASLRDLTVAPPPLEACRDQLEWIEREWRCTHSSLLDLAFLPLMRALKRQRTDSEEIARLLARTEVRYGEWLFHQDRLPEACAVVHQGLRRADYIWPREPFYLSGLNVLSANRSNTSGASASALYLLRWLPRLTASQQQMHLLSDGAVMATLAGDFDLAVRLLSDVERRLSSARCSAETAHYVRLSAARVRLTTERDIDGWEAILARQMDALSHIPLLLFGMQGVLLAGVYDAAAEYARRFERVPPAEVPLRFRLIFDKHMAGLEAAKSGYLDR